MSANDRTNLPRAAAKTDLECRSAKALASSMILRDLHRQRQLAGAIALVAMAFYAVLLPWHTVSQATGPPLGLGKSFEPPCHHASAAGDNAKAPQPAKPRTHCPICNGFAALNLATAALATVLIVRPAVHTAISHMVEDGLVGVTARAPQSRGPPSSFT
jgi:hypothetical protein